MLNESRPWFGLVIAFIGYNRSRIRFDLYKRFEGHHFFLPFRNRFSPVTQMSPSPHFRLGQARPRQTRPQPQALTRQATRAPSPEGRTGEREAMREREREREKERERETVRKKCDKATFLFSAILKDV